MKLEVFVIRIVICLVLSIIVGIERQYRHGSVGLRTNVLVGIGSFMFNYATYGFVSHDQSRIAASIVSGIGFLGAGMIIRNGNKIRGLNTAATLWCVASIGLLTSIGMVAEAIIGTLLVVFSNVVLRLVSIFIMDKVKKWYRERCIIQISCQSDIEIVVRSSFSNYVEKNGIRLIRLEKNEIAKDQIKLRAELITSRVDVIENLVKNLSAEPGITSISWKHSKIYQSDNEDASSDE